mmetsp:Transcript_5303/g.8486  ORF Transcript_5303/g.8486 Transcript_5303/m.8486 type:complete len:153 (-) Transcript_5303:97-555(-)
MRVSVSLLISGLLAAFALALLASQHGPRVSELMGLPDPHEHHMVKAARSATMSFANKDVTAAVLKAEQTAKAQYARMMASALKSEAMAHKAGEKATERAMLTQAKLEKKKMMARAARSQKDEAVQAAKDRRTQLRIKKELDRSLGFQVITGH